MTYLEHFIDNFNAKTPQGKRQSIGWTDSRQKRTMDEMNQTLKSIMIDANLLIAEYEQQEDYFKCILLRNFIWQYIQAWEAYHCAVNATYKQTTLAKRLNDLVRSYCQD